MWLVRKVEEEVLVQVSLAMGNKCNKNLYLYLEKIVFVLK